MQFFRNIDRTIVHKSALILLLILSAAAVGKVWHFAKDGFSIRRIGCSFPAPSPKSSAEFRQEWLQGPFYYLGRGRQCYAFESADRRYVLKIPRLDRYDVPFFWKAPISFFEDKRKEIELERKKRETFILNSFAIAAQDLKEQTALLYLHLHDTDTLPTTTSLIDQLGRVYEIDLNRILFAVQEKKELMMPQFLQAVANQDRETVDQIFDSFLLLLKRRAELAIFNKDPSFMKNFSWEDGQGVQIDIGSFYRRENLDHNNAFQTSLQESVGPIREWLAELDPNLLSRFDERLIAIQTSLPSPSVNTSIEPSKLNKKLGLVSVFHETY